MTDALGNFRLESALLSTRPLIAAGKAGYVGAGADMATAALPIVITLRRIPDVDDEAYIWVSAVPTAGAQPREDSREACGACHQRTFAEWRDSRHSISAVSPRFLAYYLGTDMAGRPGLGPGYRRDFPGANGDCAACHVPAQAVANPFDSDPTAAAGVALEGVTCDFCHKVGDVVVEPRGNSVGVMATRLVRPGDGAQLVLGPFDDVPRGRDGYLKLYKESRYCSACHEASAWGVAVYSEFSEWLASRYAAAGTTCQSCHMTNGDKASLMAEAGRLAIVRDPATLSGHRFSDSRDPAFLRSAVRMNVTGQRSGSELGVDVTIANVGAGHSLPAGTPMRNMILTVEATDAAGLALRQTDGPQVPFWGGEGTGAEDLAGRPGRGFAKVLRDRVGYAADPRGTAEFERMFPAPHWRPVIVDSDDRIPAGGSDASSYRFAADASTNRLRVTATLWLRRSYRSWALAKGDAGADLKLAQEAVWIEGTGVNK